jgi:signal transduction histidine kinase
MAEAERASGRLADEFTVSRYGREEGMLEVAVQEVGQTPDGFIWCLTPNHLLRFDGIGFSAFGGMDAGPIQSPYPVLFRGWAVDAAGTPWVFGRRGAARRTADGWQRLDGGEAWRPVIEMADIAGDFHAVTADGVWRVEGSRWVSGPKELKPPREMRVTCAAEDPAGGVLLGGNLGVHRFDGATYEPVLLAADEGVGEVSGIHRGESGDWWVCGAGGLFRGVDGKWERFSTPFPGDQGSALLEDEEGAVWVGTKHGLFRWRAGVWAELSPGDVATSLEVLTLMRDRGNHLWVGTADGLLCLRPKWVDVLFSKPRQGKQPVGSLALDRSGQVWAGSLAEGLLRVSGGDLAPSEIPGMPEGVGVSALEAESRGGLWVGTLGGGLLRLAADGRSRIFSEAPGSKEQANEISAILETRDRLWVGTRRGLFTMNTPDATSPAAYLEAALLRTGSSQLVEFINRVTALTESGGSGVLAGYDGLWVLRHDPDPDKSGFGYGWGLPGPNVRAFFRDSGGRLWAATSHGLGLYADDAWFETLKDNGLFVDDTRRRTEVRKAWERQGKRMLWGKITANHGLANADVRQIAEDRQGRLWLGTRKGIQIFERKDLLDVADGRKASAEGRLIGIDEGMASEECTLNSSQGAVIDTGGNLYFATTDGVVRADPKRILTPEKPPPVFIERVTAGDTALYKRPEISPLSPGNPPAEPRDEVFARPGARDIAFAFNSPAYDSPSRVQFRWLLDGLDEQWSPPSAEREVVYPRLNHGSYTFRVMAGGQGAWREAAAPFRFRISPRWFEIPAVQAAAILVCVAILAYAIRGWERRRTAKRIDRLKRDRAIERERARISRDLHDEMGVGLTEIGLLGDLAAFSDSGKSSGLATEISQRARGLVGALDEIVWAINPANDNSLSLGDYFSRYAQNLLQRAGIRCRLDVENRSLDAPIDAEGRHNLFLAFKETLNNVINHADASEVRIHIAENAGVLTVRVGDNGRGFGDSVGVGSPDGLRGLRERLAGIGGACDIRSASGEGTTVTLTLPVRKAQP